MSNKIIRRGELLPLRRVLLGPAPEEPNGRDAPVCIGMKFWSVERGVR